MIRHIQPNLSRGLLAMGGPYQVQEYEPMGDNSRFRFSDTAAPMSAPPIPYKEAVRTTPVRAPERADWTVPFMQSILTGALVGVPVGGAIGYLPSGPSIAGGAALGFVICVSGVWLWRLRAFPALLVRIEKITGLDVSDYEPPTAQPTPPPIVRVEVGDTREGGQRWQFADLPVSSKSGHAGLISFAGAIIQQGESFAERQAHEFGGYSRTEWQALRDEFVEREWATWKHPTAPEQGVDPTAMGRLVLRKLAASGVPRDE